VISIAPILAQRRLVLAAASLLVCWLTLAVSASAASIILEVGAANAPPGFNKADLPRYLALHMTEAGLTEWRFEPATGEGLAANYVLWTFRLELDTRSHRPHHKGGFSGPRPVTLEARLYLNGQYQTLVGGVALMEDRPDDPRLASAITKLTSDLLGPSGAYRRIAG